MSAFTISLPYGELIFSSTLVDPLYEFTVVSRVVEETNYYLHAEAGLPVWKTDIPVNATDWWRLSQNIAEPDADVPYPLYLEYTAEPEAIYFVADMVDGELTSWVEATRIGTGGFGTATRVHLATHISKATRISLMDG